MKTETCTKGVGKKTCKLNYRLFRYHGYGELKGKDNSYFRGSWKHGNKHGKVDEITKTGEKYIGTYSNGLKHGQGKLTCQVGGCTGYDGDWYHGKRHGDGYETYKNGGVYEGQFLNDRKHGIGTLKGKQFSMSGTWVNGCMEGYGSIVANQDHLPKHDFGDFVKIEVEAVGYFKESERHGKFRVYFRDTTYMDCLYSYSQL